MKKNILNIAGATAISKANQSTINGGKGFPRECSGCGCDCAGRVTGPACCQVTIGCPQVYTCNDDIQNLFYTVTNSVFYKKTFGTLYQKSFLCMKNSPIFAN